MNGEYELAFIDLSETIPELLGNAMRSRQIDRLRGAQAMPNSLWPILNPAIRLVELIVDARRNSQTIVEDWAVHILGSVNGPDFIYDCINWGLVTLGQTPSGIQTICCEPALWDPYLDSVSEDDPRVAPRLLGQLLGICSLASHPADRLLPDGRRVPVRSKRIGLNYYLPVKQVLIRAANRNGRLTEHEAEDVFREYPGYDYGKKWRDALYPVERVKSLRLVYDTRGNELIFNPNSLRVIQLIRDRTNEIWLARHRTI